MTAAQVLATVGTGASELAKASLRAALAILADPGAPLGGWTTQFLNAPAYARHIVRLAGVRVLDDAASRHALEALTEDEKRTLWMQLAVPLREDAVRDGFAVNPVPQA